MSSTVEYCLNKASVAEIKEHLSRFDAKFVPPLSDRVDIYDYAKNITEMAMRFEAWSGDTLVGLLAAYCNDEQNHVAYVTSISVLKASTRKGVGTRLLKQCIVEAKVSGMQQINLEVASDNVLAIKLYEKCGFVADQVNAPFVTMQLHLNKGEKHE